MLSFEQIIAEAAETVARNKAKLAKPSKSPVRAVEDPARDNLYIPHRNVYNWFQNVCECGHSWLEFDGIYEERRHPRLGHTHWVRLPSMPQTNLPRATESRPVKVPYCQECIDYAPPEEPIPESENPHHPQTGNDRKAEDLLRLPG
jgi:hypothetical protein